MPHLKCIESRSELFTAGKSYPAKHEINSVFSVTGETGEKHLLCVNGDDQAFHVIPTRNVGDRPKPSIFEFSK